MTFVALPWFVLATGGSATRMSLVLAVEVLPMALLGIPSGTLVGRLGARSTMMLCDLFRAPLIALVPVLEWTGHLTYGLLLVIVFLVGACTAPYVTSQRSIVPEVFGEDELAVTKANALFGGANQIPLVIGPALAGVLVAWLNAPAVLVIDGVTYLFAFICVFGFVRGGARIPQDEQSRGLLAGVRFMAKDRVLGPLALVVIVCNLAAAGLVTGVPLLAFTRYDENPHVAGWLFTAFGVGAVLGSFASYKLLDRFRPMRLASVAIVLASLPLWAIAFPIPWEAAFVALGVSGFFVPMVNAPVFGMLTMRPPVALRAKVLTAVFTAVGVSSPIGRLLVGPVYGAVGNAGVWVVIAGGLGIGAALWFFVMFSAGDAADVAAVAEVAHGET